MLSAAFICIVLSASAGPLPGSRRRKDNNALSSPPPTFSSLSLLFRHRRGLSGCLRNSPATPPPPQPASHNNGGNHFFICDFFFHFLMCHPDSFSFFSSSKCKRYSIYSHVSVSGVETEDIIFGHAVIRGRWRAGGLGGGWRGGLKWQIDGHLLAYFIYLFLLWPRSA